MTETTEDGFVAEQITEVRRANRSSVRHTDSERTESTWSQRKIPQIRDSVKFVIGSGEMSKVGL
jgi:hypothetical protein